MLKFRKLKSRDFIIIAIFVPLQIADLVMTLVFYEYELNPVVLWSGKEGFIAGKVLATLTLPLLYVLDVWTQKQKLILEILFVGISLPIIYMICQIIMAFVV